MAHKRPWSFCQKCRWHITPKHIYTLDPMKLEWADYAVSAYCGNLTSSHATRQRKPSATVVPARWATVDWSWHKEWNQCARANLHLQKKKKSAGREWIVEDSPKILAHAEKATTIMTWFSLGPFIVTRRSRFLTPSCFKFQNFLRHWTLTALYYFTYTVDRILIINYLSFSVSCTLFLC